jgi:hypothetical protein
MSRAEFDAQVSAWAKTYKANIDKFMKNANMPVFGGSFELTHKGAGGGSDSGVIILVGLGIAAAVAIAMSSKKN